MVMGVGSWLQMKKKNNQQTKNLFGTFWELWVTSEYSQHHEIYYKETLVSAIWKSGGLRLIVWFSGIVGVTECCIRTQQGYLTLGLQSRIGYGAVAFRKIIAQHASQGNEIKDKDIDDCRHILL